MALRWTRELLSLLEECDVIPYKASGKGGQKRNKTESAVLVVHRPTGIVRLGTESRSQSASQVLERKSGMTAPCLARLSGGSQGAFATNRSARHPRSRSSRALSRCQSRSLMVWRLSWVCLPLASASSTLARPRLLK